MKMGYIFFLLISISILSCKGKKAMSGDGDKVVDNDSLFASHQRTVCFGKCPVYILKIYDSGKMYLTAEQNTPVVGEYTGYLSRVYMDSLSTTANAIGFYQMDEAYRGMVTDVPTRITVFDIVDGKEEGETRKSVLNRFGGPPELRGLEEIFQNIVETTDWQLVDK